MKRFKNIYRWGSLCCGMAAALTGLSSCSDFLEIKPQSEIVLEDFWSEKADVDNIVTGCYSRLSNDDIVRRMMIWGEFRSDNVMAGLNVNNDGHLENILKENITASNNYTTYDAFYTVINRCNTVIKYAPGVAAVDPGYTEGELRATIAEVSALRDLCYFYLIRTFRDVPYSTNAFTDDDQVMNLPARPFNAVLDSLIEDLERVKDDAVVRYPDTKPRYQTGRITQDAIYAMLCEMYLWKKDYQQCIRYADLVIQSKKDQYEENRHRNISGGMMGGQDVVETRLNGYPLEIEQSTGGTQFGTFYRDIFVDGASRETIFELSYDDNPKASGMPSNSAIQAFYGSGLVDRGMVVPTEAIVSELDNADSRAVFAKRNKKLDARLYQNIDRANDAIAKYVRRSVTVSTGTSATPTVSYGSKFSDGDNGSKWIIYRLSDIMLLKAEALAQTLRDGTEQSDLDYNSSILAQCFSLVNAVNKRSLCQTILQDTLLASDYTTKNLMVSLVMEERQRELMFEGKRWYDLVRRSLRDENTDELLKAVNRREGVNSQLVGSFFKKMDAIFWPYNLEETKVNRNLVQNPAFGSGENDSYEKTK